MGSANSKYFIAGLAVLIVAVVGVTVWFWGDDDEPATVGKVPDGPPPYLCRACKKQFVASHEHFEPDSALARRDPTLGNHPHCPQCGAKHAGWEMVGCPACGKYYMPEGWMSLGGAASPDAKDVCPHCNTDRGEWYRTHAGRKGKGRS